MKIDGGPIKFSKSEIRVAREGNYEPIKRRLQREIPERARIFKELSNEPHTKAETRRLAGNVAVDAGKR